MSTITEAFPVETGEYEETRQGAIRTTFGTAEVVHKARELPAEAWRSTFFAEYRDARYYEIIEETMPEKFEYRYLVLTNCETGQQVVQPFFYIAQGLTDGLPQTARRLVARMQKMWPRFLVMRVLMVGCAVGEGQVNPEPWAVQALQEALRVVARQDRASVIVFKDYPARYRSEMRYFETHGYKRVPSMPAAKLELNYASFEDFMQRKLSKVFRKNLRRKFRAAAEFGPVEMSVHDDITPLVAEVYGLYRQTLERADFSFEELTPEFLARVGQEMPDRAKFFVWRHEGKIVAFNFCLLHEGVLYDLDIGLDYSLALDMHLYFLTWRDVISWALANGVKTYYTGPLNYDPKLHLRLELAPLDLYISHTSSLINPLFRVAMGFLQPVRHHPILRQFSNAGDL